MTLKYVREKFGAPDMTDAFGTAGVERGIIEAAKRNPKIVLVLADVGFPGLKWFVANAPNRVFELGIAEANVAVAASGLAADGYEPFIYGFAFATMERAVNQIRQCICVDHFNVKIMSRAGYLGTSGISHNVIEDIGIMRVMPNMVIVNPADSVEAEKAIVAIADYVGPVYFRMEPGFFSPPPLRIFKDDYVFDIGKAVTVREGGDVAIIAAGYMVTESIYAADLLKKEGIEVKIVDMSTIKPIDEEAIIEAAKETGAIVTAENHSIIGGLGEGVATVLAENLPTPMARMGVRDEFSQSGIITPEGKDELKIHLNLTAEDIAAAVKDVLKKKR
jgi:transketolase